MRNTAKAKLAQSSNRSHTRILQPGRGRGGCVCEGDGREGVCERDGEGGCEGGGEGV